MKHLDPASQEFARLPRRFQARIYLQIGWTKEALLEEFGIAERTLGYWLNEASYRKRLDGVNRCRKRRRAVEREDRTRRGEMPRRVTDGEKAAMRALRLKGKTVAEIAAITGYSVSTVGNHIAGSPHPKGGPVRKKRELDYAKAYRLRQKGMFYKDIAAAIGAKTPSAAFLAVQKYSEEKSA